MKAILIFIIVICNSGLLYSQEIIKIPVTQYSDPSDINNIKLDQYVLKGNKSNELSLQMQHLFNQMAKLSKEKVFYLSIGVSKDSIIYVMVQDWIFWYLIDNKNDYERVFGVYKNKKTGQIFVILNSGGETSKFFILNLFRKNGRYINFKRTPFPGPYEEYINTGSTIDYFLGFVIDNNLVLHDFRIRGHKTDYK